MTAEPGSTPLRCIHGKLMHERCLQCEEGMRRGEHGGFVRAPESSNPDLARSLGHFAGAMRCVLQDAGSADMRITSEDARDIQRAAEVIRLYRMARPAPETAQPAKPISGSGTDVNALLDEIAKLHEVIVNLRARLSCAQGRYSDETASKR